MSASTLPLDVRGRRYRDTDLESLSSGITPFNSLEHVRALVVIENTSNFMVITHSMVRAHQTLSNIYSDRKIFE